MYNSLLEYTALPQLLISAISLNIFNTAVNYNLIFILSHFTEYSGSYMGFWREGCHISFLGKKKKRSLIKGFVIISYENMFIGPFFFSPLSGLIVIAYGNKLLRSYHTSQLLLSICKALNANGCLFVDSSIIYFIGGSLEE